MQNKYDYQKITSFIELLYFFCHLVLTIFLIIILSAILYIGCDLIYEWQKNTPDYNIYAWLKQEYYNSLRMNALSWPETNGHVLECKLFLKKMKKIINMD